MIFLTSALLLLNVASIISTSRFRIRCPPPGIPLYSLGNVRHWISEMEKIGDVTEDEQRRICAQIDSVKKEFSSSANLEKKGCGSNELGTIHG